MNELKNCPFCGGAPTKMITGDFVWCRTSDCAGRGGAPAEQWNRRSPVQQGAEGAVAEMKGVLKYCPAHKTVVSVRPDGKLWCCLLAELEARPADARADSWVSVPREATEEMLERGLNYYNTWRGHPDQRTVVANLYKAMLSAIPTIAGTGE